jgi:hypothetical protein
MADITYNPKVYRKQGGDEFVVASEGIINIETGGIIQANGTQADHIADPSGGATVDDEARAAIVSILSALEGAGILKTS